jgi:hypothetical protein
MKTKIIPSDKIYKLVNGYTPLSFILPSRNTKRYPLMWYDEEKNQNRPLRYARNQKTPFEDEQDGNAILEPIVFTDGFLSVPKTNPVLQEFLHYHPMNGLSFVLVDAEKDAEKELQEMTVEVDALIEARQLTVEQLETVYRVVFGKDPSRYATAEIRRDIIVMAKRDPRGFMNVINDPMLKYNARVQMFFDAKLLTLRNNDKEVWFNTASNKRKLLAVPFSVDPIEAVAVYLKSDEGLDALKFLESQIE